MTLGEGAPAAARTSSPRVLLGLALLILGWACAAPGTGETDDAGTGVTDAGLSLDGGPGSAPDAGAPVDAGPAPDAGSTDGGVGGDAGPSPDAGFPADAGLMDAGPAAADPSMTGPYTITQIDGTFTVTASGDSVPMHGAYPTAGPTAGPYPVVVLAHGFQLPVTEYVGYLEALASFGYVALTADYPDPLLGPIDNVEDAQDISGGLDWASTDSTLAGLVDLSKAGVMGHSRGGNGAVLAASMDPRFLAVLGLDPVAASPTSATCPDARVAMAGLHIPSLLMGETLDGSGGLLGMSCAPLALDYQTFYAAANSPSIQVTVNGANHMSFLDNPSTCGIVCGACQTATADHTTVINMLYAYTVAFFERNLRGNTGDQTYLTGAEAQSRYTPALISIVSK